MKIPCNIYEDKSVFPYLEKRNLVTQYKKAKQYILQGNVGLAQFKERQPKGYNIWSFRINAQFRAIGSFDEKQDFRVAYIDNHQ